MTIKELKRTTHDYAYSNEELRFIFKYFKDKYSIRYAWWSKATGVSARTIDRILYGETRSTTSRTTTKITAAALTTVNKEYGKKLNVIYERKVIIWTMILILLNHYS